MMRPVLPDNYAALVTPFYMDMMRLNALANSDAELLPAITRTGSVLAADDVIELLHHENWRAKVMGAWFALMQNADDVTVAVLHALEASNGSLTSPPLIVAAVLLAGPDALGAIAVYATRDLSMAWGSCGFAAAAAEHFGGSLPWAPSEGDRDDFAQLLALALQIRSQRTSA